MVICAATTLNINIQSSHLIQRNNWKNIIYLPKYFLSFSFKLLAFFCLAASGFQAEAPSANCDEHAWLHFEPPPAFVIIGHHCHPQDLLVNREVLGAEGGGPECNTI